MVAASSFPNSSLHANSAIPRIKLNLRSATPPKALTIPPKRTAKRARTSQTEQRHLPSDSESSELTPEPEDDDNDEAEEGAVTRRTMKKETGRVSLTRNETPTHMTAMGREREKTTTSGPAGRVRKRAVKLGEVERRRARDEKFGVGLGEGYSAPVSCASCRMNPFGF
jgi:hypothetical protein